MKRGERFIVNVAPELDISSLETLFNKLNVLFKASMVYSLRLELHSAMKVILDLARDLVDFEKAIFYLVDDEDKSFFTGLIEGFPEKLPKEFHRGNIFLEWTVENRLPIRVQEAASQDIEEAFKQLDCQSLVSIPIIVESNIRAVIQLFSSKQQHFSDESIRFLWILTLQLEGLFHKLRRHEFHQGETTDPFTDLPLRPMFEAELDREFLRSRRNNRPFSLLLIAIDNFDELKNQTIFLGSGMIIREVVQKIIPMIRRIDTFTRYSNGSLALLLPETELHQANLLANRIKSRVAAAPMTALGGTVNTRFTVSIGLSGFPMNVTIGDIIAEAERNLEQAVKSGGNTVVSQVFTAGHLEGKPVSLDLQKLLDTLGKIFDMESLLSHLVDFFSGLTRADRVSILLLDDTGDHLVFKHGIGFQGFEDEIQRSVIAVEDSICGQALKDRKPLLVDNVDLFMPGRTRHGLRYSSPSFLSIPLIYEEQAIGVVNFSNRRDRGSFSEDDLNVILPQIQIMAKLLAEGKRFNGIQKNFLHDTADILLNIAENKSPYLRGHSDRVSESSYRLARSLNLPEQEVTRIANAARFHDLGRIAVDESILSKPGPLDTGEKNIVSQHPLWSTRILQSFPQLDIDLGAVRTHHERFDGQGYPDGLLGKEIPLGGRILAVTDAFDAMTTERPYRSAMSSAEALKTLEQESGTHFDERVVKAFKEVVEN